jgi:hypothetical protein
MAAAAGLEPEALKIDPADEARIRAVAEGSPADELFFKAKLKVDAAMRRVLFTETTGEPPGAWRGRGKGPS